MSAHGAAVGRDRVLGLVVWATAVVCIALAWNAIGSSWRGIGAALFLGFAALYLAVFGSNLWNARYSREGDAWIEAFARNLPWMARLP